MANSYQQGRQRAPLSLEITPFNVRWDELMPELQLEILRFINTAASAPNVQNQAIHELGCCEEILRGYIRASMQVEEEVEE